MLFNSGGVMFPPVDQLTADGYDLQFGTNVLGGYHVPASVLHHCSPPSCLVILLQVISI